MTVHPIEPTPASAHPATREQRWRAQPNWWVVGLAAALALFGVVQLLRGSGSGVHGAIEAFVLAVLVALVVPLVDPVRRQKGRLRKNGWVAYDQAEVTRTPRTKLGSVNVRLVDATGTVRSFQTSPQDDDFVEGDRPVWVAGSVESNIVVVSLREGQCTGMAYRHWIGPPGSRTADQMRGPSQEDHPRPLVDGEAIVPLDVVYETSRISQEQLTRLIDSNLLSDVITDARGRALYLKESAVPSPELAAELIRRLTDDEAPA